MAVDRYAADGVGSRRTVRSRYDIPPPKDLAEGEVAAILLPRSAARSEARAKART
jgi:hypothetical protein